MKIQAVGGCCKRSQQSYLNTVEAVKKLGLDVEVEHIVDAVQGASLGVMSNPGIVIDGKVVSTGRLLEVEQIVELIKKQM
ncbi:MAG: thioredoxin family protein [Bacilli bacterium]|nr:thioredoxin family protein [Bacilli bacterium]MDD4123644.1 thioredoxin family protein [Bacilli bacterium]